MTNREKIRLHKAVKQHLRVQSNLDYSDPEIQRNIAEYGVLIDQQLVFNRLEWVYPWQVLSVVHWPDRPKGNLDGIRVLEENNNYLLLFKPPNLVVQPGTGHREDNLLNWLIRHYPEQEALLYQSSFYGDYRLEKKVVNPSAGLVHRLDKDAQGLILVARSLPDLDFLQNQFRQRQVIKKYLCVLSGLLRQEVTVRGYQARNQRQPIRQIWFWTEAEAQKYPEKTRDSYSQFRPVVLCSELQQTLAEVQIFTGRMHQIRLQAEVLGLPLVGDKLYNQAKSLTHVSSVKLQLGPELSLTDLPSTSFQRLKQKFFGTVDFCLLANELGFRLPSGEYKHVQLFSFKDYFEY